MDSYGNSEDEFLKAIQASPNDMLPRLVFADWLEEQGDTAGAAGQRWLAKHGKRPRHTNEMNEINSDNPLHTQLQPGYTWHTGGVDTNYDRNLGTGHPWYNKAFEDTYGEQNPTFISGIRATLPVGFFHDSGYPDEQSEREYGPHGTHAGVSGIGSNLARSFLNRDDPHAANREFLKTSRNVEWDENGDPVFKY